MAVDYETLAEKKRLRKQEKRKETPEITPTGSSGCSFKSKKSKGAQQRETRNYKVLTFKRNLPKTGSYKQVVLDD